MTARQLLAVFTCITINTLDGFDVLVIAFAGPSIAREWGLSPDMLGILFSAGLLGMTLGSILLAPLADRHGRRPITLLCLLIITLGMYMAAMAGTMTQLASMRFITGLGIGGMLASLNTLVAEYSPRHLRSLMVSLFQVGYPIGATLGGIVAWFLIAEYGWRSLFWFGGSLSLLALPVALWRLPESAEYFFASGRVDALARGNDERRKLGLAPLDRLPVETGTGQQGLLKIIWRDLRSETLLLWSCFFMLMLTWYFVVNWTPKLLVDAGFNVSQGISGGVVLSIGGVIGGIMLGALSVHTSVFTLTRYYAFAAAICLAMFALLAGDLRSMMLLAGLIGFAVAGTMVGLHACAPLIYPAQTRNTGLGWAIGVGRSGAVLGPYLAGLLLGRGMSRTDIYMIFCLPMVMAVIALWRLARQHESRQP